MLKKTWNDIKSWIMVFLRRKETKRIASSLACSLIGNQGSEHSLPPHMRRKRPSYKEALKVKEEMMGMVDYSDLSSEACGSILRTACENTPGYFNKKVYNNQGELCQDIIVPLGHIKDAPRKI